VQSRGAILDEIEAALVIVWSCGASAHRPTSEKASFNAFIFGDYQILEQNEHLASTVAMVLHR
jgi:hypothetical protein